MKIAIHGRPFATTPPVAVQKLVSKLKLRDITPVIYEPFYRSVKERANIPKCSCFSHHNDIHGKVDFLFSMGGDGTLLETLVFVRDSGIPVMGINTGKLGFLSSVSAEETEAAVDAIVDKKYSLDNRTLIRLDTKQKLFSEVNFALNEITIHRKDSSSLITINAWLNGEFLNAYWADGLIIATPTGSTAYSLSCGGPVVAPDSENFVITPVSPHNLNVRPLIISDHDVIKLKVEGKNEKFLVSLDSRSETIDSSVELTVRKESFCMNLVKLTDGNFLATLRNKLMWGADKRN